MTKRSQPEWLPPPGQPIPGRRGPRGTYDPFYVFENRARPGKPAPAPRRELLLMAVLGSKTALTVMGCLLFAVVAVLLVLLVTRA
jgi:hypothetical protein